MRPCRKYDFIIKNKVSSSTSHHFSWWFVGGGFPIKPKKNKKTPHLHNNHLVSVIPKSIYSHSHPADVMHHSTSNLTSLSNILLEAAAELALLNGWVLIPLSHNKIKE